MRRALALALALVGAPAAAQLAVNPNLPIVQQADPSGAYVGGVGRSASTTVSGSVATANTFQSALAANASRKGCALYNVSANAELVYLGAPGSATATTSIPVPAGGSFNCGSPQGLVVTDQISITSATAGSTFVLVFQ